MSTASPLALPWLAAPLAQALATQRGHAVLVHGPQGVGQWELAIALAQAWLCEDHGGATRPCGHCAGCKLVAARSHPDLIVLLPEALQAGLGWGSVDADGEAAETGTKTRQPSKEIKVDAVRAAVSFAQTTPARGGAKVVVIHPAERMNAISANTLLKTLEEPPGAARFVLSSAAPEQLLPTLRSRCQAFALTLPEAGQATQWLQAQKVAAASVLLAATAGQPQQALEWSREGVDASQWTRLPEQLARGEAGLLAGWPLPRVVEALHKVCHDALSVAVGAPPRFFVEARWPKSTPLTGLLAWSRLLNRAARSAEHPLNAGLQTEALVAQAQRALSGEPPEDDAAVRGVSVHSRA